MYPSLPAYFSINHDILQSYFRETSLPPLLFALLQFPVVLSHDQAAPQEFALQFWDDQKRVNASLVLGVIAMLLALKGHGVCCQDYVSISELIINCRLKTIYPTQDVWSN